MHIELTKSSQGIKPNLLLTIGPKSSIFIYRPLLKEDVPVDYTFDHTGYGIFLSLTMI